VGGTLAYLEFTNIAELMFDIILPKKQEKRGNPGKVWRAWLSWLFSAFFFFLTLESLEKPEKHGNSWLSWKGRDVLPRKAWKARRGLLAFAESVDLVHTYQTQEARNDCARCGNSWLS